jgi:hypothetical protein
VAPRWVPRPLPVRLACPGDRIAAEPSAVASRLASQVTETTAPLSEESVALETSVASAEPPPVSHSSMS